MMMLLDRVQTKTTPDFTFCDQFSIQPKHLEGKRKFAFIAHYVENWNWLLPFNHHLNQHPEHAGRWMPLWPLFFIISVSYLCGRKAYDQVCKFTFHGSLEGRIDVIRNFGWHFLLNNQWKKIRERILQTVLEEQENVDVIGLGALTKAEWLTAGGKWIVDELGDKLHVPIVHGDTLTAAAIINRCVQLIDRYNIKSVFVTGATSKIGRALVLSLASRRVAVKLFTNSQERFDEIKVEAGVYGIFLTRAIALSDGSGCKLWVTGKAIPSGRPLLNSIPSNAIVVNFSVPNPISEGLYKKRPDVLPVEGGLLYFDPKISSQSFNMRLNPGETYACHAGTMVHAYKRWTHHEVGPVDMNTIDETWDAAVELGFFLKPLSDQRNSRSDHDQYEHLI
jgi:hypothetical protein